jgi:hypothetical protein
VDRPNTKVIISRLDGGAELVIDDGYDVAREFFTKDASSTSPSGYDAMAGKTSAHRIVFEDVDVIYRTMRMRSRRDAWDGLIAQVQPQPWLRALDRSWELLEVSDEQWARQVAPRLERAFAVLIGPHRQLTGVSKILHLKRPRLVPILDDLAVEQLGARAREPIAVIAHYRHEMRVNGAAIRDIVAMLEQDDGISRTPVRVMDALLWTSHPGSGLPKKVNGWERHLLRGTPFMAMLVLGIDLASQPKRTAACLLDWAGGTGRIAELRQPVDDDVAIELAQDAALVAIDAPFGWPAPFVAAVSGHAGGSGWPATANRDLAYRRTDQHVAVGFQLGRVEAIPDAYAEIARSEGWIWLPDGEPLS